MDYYAGQKTYWNFFGPKPLGYHVHKKAFIDSFQRWLFKTLDPGDSNTTYVYLTQNPDVLRQVFHLFADKNLVSPTEEGVYMEVPYGGYSSNANLRCLTLAGDYLNSTPGLVLLQQLGNGDINIQEFEDLLPFCD